MGIDLAKMKEKLNALENKGQGKSVFWRPEDGEQTIRIVPTADGDPFKEYWFHYIRLMTLLGSSIRMALTSQLRWLRTCLHVSDSLLLW